MFVPFESDPPDLVIVVGTSALFPYIAEPVFVARALDRVTIEVNPEPTVVTDAARWSFRKPAGEILPVLAAALQGDVRE